MLNYLIDLHRLRHNPFNGLYIFSCSLAEHLLKHTHENEQLFYYLPKEKYGLFGDKPVYTEHKRWHKFFQPGTKKYDVWHLTTGISQYRPFNSKTKVVYTIHDVNFLVEEPDNVRQNKRTLSLMQKNINQASHIVCISNHALAFASQQLDFDNKPTSVIYNGCTLNEFPEFDKPIYRPDKPFLFSIGLVQPRKNFHTLPALLSGNDYQLIIAGLNNFDYAKKVMNEAKKWNVEDRVKLIGPIDEKSKYWYYKNCEAFLFPSIAEGFGFPPVEAMLLGKPVFLSKLMSLPEIGGDVAYYFNDFDPEEMKLVFEKGMHDYAIYNRGIEFKKQAGQFDWDKAAKEYLLIYRNCLK